jgi:hypothetical protein
MWLAQILSKNAFSLGFFLKNVLKRLWTPRQAKSPFFGRPRLHTTKNTGPPEENQRIDRIATRGKPAHRSKPTLSAGV